MDSSGLIFVALAIAWACYLIPKALRNSDQEKQSRPVDRFSHRMRVLARRGDLPAPASGSASGSRAPVGSSGGRASAGNTGGRVPPRNEAVYRDHLTTAQLVARRAAHRKATKRRRNVLALILVSLATVATLAGLHYFSWWYVAIPGGVLLTWLITCRVMVKGERAGLRPEPVVLPSDSGEVEDELVHPDEFAVAVNDQGFDEVSSHAITAVLADSAPQSGLWDPVPMTLPTYVDKDPAPNKRTMASIDLDSTGVWSSGRSESDSAIAREAEASAKSADTSVRRASGE